MNTIKLHHVFAKLTNSINWHLKTISHEFTSRIERYCETGCVYFSMFPTPRIYKYIEREESLCLLFGDFGHWRFRTRFGCVCSIYIHTYILLYIILPIQVVISIFLLEIGMPKRKIFRLCCVLTSCQIVVSCVCVCVLNDHHLISIQKEEIDFWDHSCQRQ